MSLAKLLLYDLQEYLKNTDIISVMIDKCDDYYLLEQYFKTN